MEKELLTIDALKYTRQLPADILANLGALIVDRKGTNEEAYMRLENLIGYVKPKTHYRLTETGFTEAPNTEIKPLPPPVKPPCIELTGQWQNTAELDLGNANILGDNGRYILGEGESELVIPIAETTPEHLAYYRAQLVKIGDAVSFETDGNLPLTVTSIGKTYADDYLTRADYGGGAYLEVHDRPHFHMPLNENAGGYLFLGKTDGKSENAAKRVSAFKIPYGYGIHMAPWTIHADSHLVGRYLVIYSVTKAFSTVIIRQANGELAKIKVR